MGIVNIIIYDDFVNPKHTYDLIVGDFIKSEFIDSIKIVGKPLFTEEINFKIDTARVHRYGIQLNDLVELLDSIKKQSLPENFENHNIQLIGDRQIPVSAVSIMHLELKPYKPKIFLPEPKCYKFKNECVVKVELYCKKQSRKKIIEYIQASMNKYTTAFINEMWRYEIVKDKLPDNFKK